MKIQTGEIEETFEDDLDISEYQSKKKNRHSYDDEYESSPMTSSWNILWLIIWLWKIIANHRI